MSDSYVAAYLEEVRRLLEMLDAREIEAFAEVIWQTREKGGFVFACGNGGSAATASHFIEDLAKGISFPPGEPRFRALALTDSIPLITAYANDTAYEHIFAEQMENFISPGDVLISFSGSGNSPSVLRAIEKANAAGAATLAFGGMGGGKMKHLAQRTIIVPSNNMQQIEDCHLVLAHALYVLLRERGEGKAHC
jgi:D-sedoheptulose 7-phosphate isomerase